jgi:hypothetical protein
MKPRYELWARSAGEHLPTLRVTGDNKFALLDEGERLARASTDHGGVMSVWVQNENGTVLWAAGEKHDELQADPTQEQEAGNGD